MPSCLCTSGQQHGSVLHPGYTVATGSRCWLYSENAHKQVERQGTCKPKLHALGEQKTGENGQRERPKRRQHLSWTVKQSFKPPGPGLQKGGKQVGVTIRSGREGKAKDQALNAPTPPTHSAQPIATTQTRHRRLLGSQEAGSLAFPTVSQGMSHPSEVCWSNLTDRPSIQVP